MNAERLLRHYEKIADTPDAIPRLRRFILELAVRGKLVPQDPTDEPAAALINKIADAKTLLGNSPNQTLNSDGLAPFPLPSGWSWITVGDACTKTGSGSTPRGGKDAYAQHGVPFLRSQNIYNDGVRLDDVAYIDDHTHARMSGTHVRPGDLLLNITGGSMGRCCRVPGDFTCANISQHVAIIRPAVRGVEDFLHLVVLSPYFQAFVFENQTGAGRGGLPKNKMDQILVPLPPLAEQRRIVSKVDELMRLCDELESRREEREGYRDGLVRSSYGRLNETECNDFRAAASFAIKTLGSLTARSNQIKHLRQTILNLAVRGKLVPQDPTDEPVEELLNRIQKDNSQLSLKSKARKTNKATSTPTNEFSCFALPGSWRWARFAEIASVQSNLVDPQHYGQYPHIAPDNIESRTGRLLPYETIGDSQVFSVKHLFNPGCLLYSKIRPALAKVTSIDFEGLCSADMYPICPFIYREYLKTFMLADIFISQSVSEDNRVAMPKINQESLSKILVAIPPLAEQHRIVAKVNELNALCDELESSLTITDTTRKQLLESLLSETFAINENFHRGDRPL